MLMLRTGLLLALTILCLRMAAGTPVLSLTNQTLFTDTLPAGSITTSASDSFLNWQGRSFSLLEAGVAYGVTDGLAIGVNYRRGSGHGRSRGNTYDSTGGDGWLSLRLLKEAGWCPALTLLAQTLHDDVTLRSNSATESALSEPNITDNGISLNASRHAGDTTWTAAAGVFQTSVFGEQQATVLALGVGAARPFSSSLRGEVSLAGYRDAYNDGHHFSGALQAGLTAGSPAGVHAVLSGVYYPRGVPLAGTPYSPASMAGAFFGGSATAQLRSSAVGFLTLGAAMSF